MATDIAEMTWVDGWEDHCRWQTSQLFFLGDKCCACLRLQHGNSKSGDGGAGDGRMGVEGDEP